jgi:hypothetical protein
MRAHWRVWGLNVGCLMVEMAGVRAAGREGLGVAGQDRVRLRRLQLCQVSLPAPATANSNPRPGQLEEGGG